MFISAKQNLLYGRPKFNPLQRRKQNPFFGMTCLKVFQPGTLNLACPVKFIEDKERSEFNRGTPQLKSMLCRFRLQDFEPFFGLPAYLGGRIQDDAEKNQAPIVIAVGMSIISKFD
jgi:hypothetical protein